MRRTHRRALISRGVRGLLCVAVLAVALTWYVNFSHLLSTLSDNPAPAAAAAVPAAGAASDVGLAAPGSSGTDSRPSSQSPSRRRPVKTAVVAYCVFPENKAVPTGHAEFMARTYGPHMFPAPQFRLELRPVLPLPRDLPPNLDPKSPEGLHMLGLSGAHVRFCPYGSSQLVSLLRGAGLAEIRHDTREAAQARLRAAGVHASSLRAPRWLTRQTCGRPRTRTGGRTAGWCAWAACCRADSHARHWPVAFTLVADKASKRPFGPLIFRHSPEPLPESVGGVAGQLDVKRALRDLSTHSITMYWPMIMDSMAFRWAAGNSSYQKKIGGSFATIKDGLTRPSSGFDAAKERKSKLFFVRAAVRLRPHSRRNCVQASSISGHCAGRRAHYPSVIVRELFTYALAERSGRPVHNIGGWCVQAGAGGRAALTPCAASPDGDAGATRAGLALDARAALQAKYRHSSVAAIHADHKFAVTFENSGIEGYFTEKVVSGYIARSVPVYNGPPDFARVLNPKAVIDCGLPLNVTSYASSLRMKNKVCAALPVPASSCAPADKECVSEHGRRVRDLCAEAYHAHVESLLWPLLLKCADEVLRVDSDDALYDAMLAQPLVPLDARGEMTGIWNASAVGRALRAIFVGSGFEV
jgi:hypothetical protein